MLSESLGSLNFLNGVNFLARFLTTLPFTILKDSFTLARFFILPPIIGRGLVATLFAEIVSD